MARFANSVLFVPTAGGTTDFTVSSAAQGYMTPALAGAPTGTYKYRAESSDLSQWEIGEGTYTSGTGVLTRTTVLYNSSGTGTAAGQSGAGTKINFAAPPNVGIVQTVEDTLGIDQANSFTTLQKAQARANLDVAKFNYVINGAMMISQEWPTTSGATTGFYPVDMFHVNWSHAGTVSTAQMAIATPAGSPNRLRVVATATDTSVAAGDFMHIVHEIEGLRSADLLFGTASAKSIIIQFGVRGPAGTYSVTVINSATNRSYVAEYVISGGEANTDVVKSVIIPGDTSGTWLTTNGIGLIVRWGLMTGTTFQQAAGSWGTTNAVGSPNQFNFMGTISNTFDLFDVAVHEGTSAPAFQVPDFAGELTKCERYYQKTYDINTLPGAITSNGQLACRSPVTGGTDVDTFQKGIVTRFRTAPTVKWYSPTSGTADRFRNVSGAADVTVTGTNGAGETTPGWPTCASTPTAGAFLTAHFTANARL